VGLIQQGARHRHPRVFKDRIPARFLVVEPLPYALAIGHSRRGGDVRRKATQPLAQRKHPQALALACPVQESVELGAQGFADRRRDRRQFPGELVERVVSLYRVKPDELISTAVILDRASGFEELPHGLYDLLLS